MEEKLTMKDKTTDEPSVEINEFDEKTTDIPEILEESDVCTYTFYTTSLIADILQEPKHVIGNLIRQMESEGILSTSNKESGTHRKLNENDFEKIKSVIEGNRKLGISYKAGIAELKLQQETGTSRSLQDLYVEQKKATYNLEQYEKILNLLKKAVNDEAEETRIAIINSQNEAEFKIRHQIEKMNEEQTKLIEELKSEIVELKEKLEQKEEKPKKKFFGIF